MSKYPSNKTTLRVNFVLMPGCICIIIVTMQFFFIKGLVGVQK